MRRIFQVASFSTAVTAMALAAVAPAFAQAPASTPATTSAQASGQAPAAEPPPGAPVGDLNADVVAAGAFPGSFKIPGPGGVSLGIGGFVKALFFTDSNIEGRESVFLPALIGGVGRDDEDGTTSLSAELTRLSFDARVTAGEQKMRGYVEFVSATWAGDASAGQQPPAPPAPQPMPAPPAQADLAAQLANPIANLISVPLQNNWDFSIGPNELDWNAARYTVNIQPVIPFSVSEDWNLITRTIVPVVAAGSPGPEIEGATGFGDIVQSFFFSPKGPVGGWILGAGPAMLYATATDRLLGAGQWGVGPTAVGLQQKGAVTYGALVNHLWTYAGDDDRAEVNATFMNPFFSYITAKKTTYTISPEISYDWTNDQWIAPVNVVVSQLMMAGKQPYSIGGGLRFYLDTPTGGPAWGIRFSFTMLFPK